MTTHQGNSRIMYNSLLQGYDGWFCLQSHQLLRTTPYDLPHTHHTLHLTTLHPSYSTPYYSTPYYSTPYGQTYVLPYTLWSTLYHTLHLHTKLRSIHPI